ncbi:MAG: hypothetical protein NUV68_07805 [Caldiserica bacterium]|nr:hypothetical protein [Caldisericota bacterium]
MFGWTGNILRVNLTEKKLSRIPTSHYAPKFLGGRGIASRIYWEEIPPETKALSSENKLIFMTGPFCGTIIPTSSRTTLVGKANFKPKERYLSSNAGGHWGAELKFAGFDGLIIEGKSSKPVYVLIENENIEIRSAEKLWGLDTFETQKRIQEELGSDTSIACIGQAGENFLETGAIITGDSDSWGHGGFGGIMGFKNLKAIAIKGKDGVKIFDPKGLLDRVYKANRLITRRMDENEPPAPHRGQMLKDFPEKTNFPIPKGTTFLLEEEAKSGEVRLGFTACQSCPVGCAISVQFKDNFVPPGSVRCADFGGWMISEAEFYKQKGLWGRTAHWASRTCDLLGLNNYEFCDKWMYQAFKKGLLPDFVSSSYGSQKFWEKLLPSAAKNSGLGELFANGGKPFLSQIFNNSEDSEQKIKAIQVFYQNWNKDGTVNYLAEGGEIEPEYSSVLQVILDGLGETGNRALAHQIYNPSLYHTAPNFPYGTAEFFTLRDAVGRDLWGVKKLDTQNCWSIPLVEWALNETILCNALELCALVFPLLYSAYTPDHRGDANLPSHFFKHLTGENFSQEELHNIFAKRIHTLERMILIREGRTSSDDVFHDEVFQLPWVKTWLSKEKAISFLRDFYEARGWERDSGVPKRRVLIKLGLGDLL